MRVWMCAWGYVRGDTRVKCTRVKCVHVKCVRVDVCEMRACGNFFSAKPT